jgi:hypothetical protein
MNIVFHVEFMRSDGRVDFVGIASTLEIALCQITAPEVCAYDDPPYSQENRVGFLIHMVDVDNFDDPSLDTFNSLGNSIYGP